MSLTKLQELHVKLAETYSDLLNSGVDDPRVLKEVREFLRDNNITETDIAMGDIKSTNKPIEFESEIDWRQEQNG